MVCEDDRERKGAERRLTEYRDQLHELNAELCRAEEREQRRIARVLHDELGQTFAITRMMICELRDSELCEARAGRLDELYRLVGRSIEVTRSLTAQLSPPILYDLGLAAALQALGERTEKDHGIRFVFECRKGWSPPADEVGVVLYRVLRELLHNVVKHAFAGGVRLGLSGTGEELHISLEDDGVGFRSGDGTSSEAGCGLGLFHVRERMARLGGRFEIDSAPGRGTRALLSLAKVPAS